MVFVDPERFEVTKTREIGIEVDRINKKLQKENRKYILIGFGRWATSDPWLGIPVQWNNISHAKVIIESNLADFKIEPSHGSHFFHNLISLKLGYFHIKSANEKEFVLWDWLKQQRVETRTKHLLHLRFRTPLIVKIDAQLSRGVIFKPGRS